MSRAFYETRSGELDALTPSPLRGERGAGRSPAGDLPLSSLLGGGVAVAVTLLLLFNGGLRPPFTAAYGLFLAALVPFAPGLFARLAAPTGRALLAFGLWAALAAAFAVNPRVACHQLLLFAAGTLTFLLVAATHDRTTARAGLARLGSGLALYLGAAILHTLLVGEGDFYYARFGPKFVFTLGHYNHTGTLLLFLLPLPFAFLPGRVRPALAWILLLAVALATSSRGAVGAALLSVAALIWKRYRGRDRRLVAALVLAGLAAAYAGLAWRSAEIRDKLGSEFLAVSREDGRGRSDIWSAAARMFRDRPVLGVGPGNYPVEAPLYAQAQLLDAHNLFLGLLAETGLPGLLLFALFLGRLLIPGSCGGRVPGTPQDPRSQTVMRTRTSPALRALPSGLPKRRTNPASAADDGTGFALRVGLLAALVQNLVASTLTLAGGLTMIFFYGAGLLDALGREPDPDRAGPTADGAIPLRLAMNALLIAILLFFATLFLAGPLTPYLFPFLLALAGGLSFRLTLRTLDLPAAGRTVRRLVAFALLLAFALPAVRLALAEGDAFRGLLADREGRVADAVEAFSGALRFDPANAVYLVNRAALASRTGPGGEADLARAAALLPFCPLARPLAPGIDPSGYPELDAADGFAAAVSRNPATAWSRRLADPARLGDPAFVDRLAARIAPARVSGRNAPVALLGDWFAAAGRYTFAVELYRASPATAPFMGEGIRAEDLRGGAGAQAKRLFDLLAAGVPPANHSAARFAAILRAWRDGGTLETRLAGDDGDPEHLVRRAMLELLAGDEPGLLADLKRAQAAADRRRPPPTHFAYMAPLVRDARRLPLDLRPLPPCWLTDNFVYAVARVEVLPFLAAAVRRGGTVDHELLARFFAASVRAATER